MGTNHRDDPASRDGRSEPPSRDGRASFCAAGPRPERVYTHAVLLELKMHPLAQIWPDYLSAVYKNTRGVWDPDRWHLEQKRSETPVAKEDGDKREEKEGEKEPESIILSPQRASFLSGCQAAKDELNLRPDQPGAGRRVGSGRILRPEKEEVPPHRGARVRVEREPGREWDRSDFSKYGFRREDEERRGWEERREHHPEERGMDRRRGRGGMSGGGGARRRDNEPEWMHESVALTDIIELKGFEDKGRGSRPNSRQSIKSDQSNQGSRGSRQPSGNKIVHGNILGGGTQPAPGVAPAPEKDGFNFDHIMESMNLNSLLGGSVVEEVPVKGNTGAQSRFSQFFQPRAEPTTQSRRSSIQDELLGSNILREINGEPTIKIPSPNDSNKYFTPISPAAKTVKGNNVLLDMLQKGNQTKVDDTMVQKLEDGIKRSLGLEDGMRGLEDAMRRHEDGMRSSGLDEGLKRSLGLGMEKMDPRFMQHHRQQQQQPPPQPQQQQQQQYRQQVPQQQQQQPPPQDNDLSAFKKLVAQVKGQPAERAPAPGFMPGLVRPTPISSLPPTALTENDILEGRGGQRFMGFQALPVQLLQFLEHYPLNRDVLRRSEAEHLLTSINNGSVPMESLVRHLSNMSLPARQRELILNVLKWKTMNIPPPSSSSNQGLSAPQVVQRSSPLNEFFLSQPPPVHHSRVSPLLFGPGAGAGAGVGPGGSHLSVSPAPQAQRVPSPQEMTVLTQQILQQALIKKKLEEQKENYRRKHEGKMDEKENMRGFRAPENGCSSSPLAFTPTSVMRKNAADRKDSDPRSGSGVPELKITAQEEMAGFGHPAPVSPGRPILKGTGAERPGVLDLGVGRSSRSNPGLDPGQGRVQGHGLPGILAGGQGVNPLLYLANQQIQQPVIGHGGVPQFGGHLNGILGGRLPPQNMMVGHPMGRAGPPSPRGGAPPAPNTLSRFFPTDVLAAAAAAGGVGPPKMPPLPTGQALTLEEIERHAAAVKI